MPSNSQLNELRAGAIATLPIGISTAVFGLSVGALAHTTGLSWIEMGLMSAIVFAGSSQAVAIGLWDDPLPIAAIVVTTFFVNIRHIPMGAVVGDLFGGLDRKRLFSSIFLMCDSSWSVVLSAPKHKRGFSYFLGSGLAAYFLWLGSTLTGHALGGFIEDPSRLGLDFAMTAIFIYLLVSNAREEGRLSPLLVAGLCAAAVYKLVPGTWYIIAGSLLGSLFGALFTE